MHKKTTFPVLLFMLLLLAVQPMLRGHLPWRGDGLLHFVRLAQLERAVRLGDIFPRWTADLGYGYGFPLFNFYAPFSYYAALPFRLLGLSLSLSLQISYALSLGVMAAGVYLWARRMWDGAVAGTVAGTTAVFTLIYTPYLLYNLYHRAALAELWGMAWLVVTLWAIAGIGDQESGIRRGILAAISYALLILSHNITAMIGTPIIIAYLLFNLWQTRPHSQFKIHHSLFIIAGLALAAFFWMPAFFEKDAVQIENLYVSANFTYENHFLTLKELFAWPQTAVSTQINPSIPRSLSWPIILLSLLAWLPCRNRNYQFRLVLTLVTIGLILMTLPISKPIWDTITLLQFVQFPWRFLGPATITLAMLAALGAKNIYDSIPSTLLLPPILIMLFALPWLFPSQTPPLPDSMPPIQTINFEAETGWLGTTAAADYLPRTVQELPAADSLLARYEAVAPDGVIDRLQTPITAQETQENLTDSTLVYEIEEETAVTFLRFSFLGWRGWLDGEPIELGISEPHGLITAVFPPGRHTFELKLTNTPLQTAANIISTIAMLITCILLFATRRSPLATRFTIHYSLFFLVILFVVLKTAVLDHTNTSIHHAALDQKEITTPLHVNFGDQIQLIGANLPAAPIPADETIDLTLFWQALPPVDDEYSVSVQLLAENGRFLAQSDSFHPAGLPLPRWQAGEYGRDLHQIAIPPATPPALYTLRLFVYKTNGGQRLDMLNGDGLPIGNAYELGQITISPPTTFPAPDAVEIGQRMLVDVSENVQLLGFDQPFAQIEAGQRVPLSLYWHTPKTPAAEVEAIIPLDCAEQGIIAEAAPVTPDPTGPASRDQSRGSASYCRDGPRCWRRS